MVADLRIRRSQHSPTTLVYPNTISCQNDGDMLDRMGERLNFIKDADHLNSAVSNHHKPNNQNHNHLN